MDIPSSWRKKTSNFLPICLLFLLNSNILLYKSFRIVNFDKKFLGEWIVLSLLVYSIKRCNLYTNKFYSVKFNKFDSKKQNKSFLFTFMSSSS